jgi:hypothetical protein
MRLGAGQGTVTVLMWPTLLPTMGSVQGMPFELDPEFGTSR